MDIIRKGDFADISDVPLITFKGFVDGSVHIEECRFYDEVTTTTDSQKHFPALSFQDTASPHIVNTKIYFGRSGTESHAVELLDSSAPKLDNISTYPYEARFDYTYSNAKEELTLTSSNHMIRKIRLEVVTPSDNLLNIGTVIEGKDLCGDVSLNEAGTYTLALESHKILNRNSKLYFSTSSDISDEDFKVTIITEVSNHNADAVYMNSDADVQIIDSSLTSNSTSNAVYIDTNAIGNDSFNIYDCYMKSSVNDNGAPYLVDAISQFNNAPIINCIFKGTVHNVEPAFEVYEAQRVSGKYVNDSSVSENTLWTSSKISSFIRDLFIGLDWQRSVISRTVKIPPTTPNIGDRYVLDEADELSGEWQTHINQLAEWQGESWYYYSLNSGMAGICR